MKSKIGYLYNIEVKNIIKLTPNCYKIITNDSSYLLKKVDTLNKENIYIRLLLAKVPFFNLPIKSINDRFVEEIEQNYYILSYFYKDEVNPLAELRIPFYIKAIGLLHQNTIYPLKVNDGYFKESLDYIENKINIIRDKIDSRMFYLERRDYHSPSEWYYITSYIFFNDALNKSQKYLDLLNNEFESLQNIELTLTYQNFEIEHILLKEEKIVSLEKIQYAPCVYDLVDFVEKNFNSKIDISALINNYVAINPLNLYQKYWLLALLYIPQIIQESNEIKDIEAIYLSLNYIKIIEKIESVLLPEEN